MRSKGTTQLLQVPRPNIAQLDCGIPQGWFRLPRPVPAVCAKLPLTAAMEVCWSFALPLLHASKVSAGSAPALPCNEYGKFVPVFLIGCNCVCQGLCANAHAACDSAIAAGKDAL